jgi:mannan endo-1,4-beta-mannosidase
MMQQLFYTSKIILVIVISFLCLSCKVDSPEIKTVNPNASPEAKALLQLLYELSGSKTLSGQHVYCNDLKTPMDSLRSITQKYPAVWGSDLMGYDHGSHDTRQEVIDEAIRQHENGSIITLMYHMVKPWHHDSLSYPLSVKGMVSDEEWKKVITPGTVEHRQFFEKIDYVADFLKQLHARDIPVLWRPFHEMNGNWFWYGDRPGENGVIQLWKLMYQRYVEFHKLDNLIWVWNPNAPRKNAKEYHLFYPGNDYVDVLAADVYGNDYKQSHHDELVELGNGKPIAIGECGQLPTPEILDQQNQWVWFMCWSNHIFSANDRLDVQLLYNSDRVLDRDKMQTLK